MIKEAWTDSKGNIWYKVKFNASWMEQILHEMGKISDSGKVWETVYSSIDYPDKIDFGHFNYRIRYRQE